MWTQMGGGSKEKRMARRARATAGSKRQEKGDRENKDRIQNRSKVSKGSKSASVKKMN